jgi:hypothetical protein
MLGGVAEQESEHIQELNALRTRVVSLTQDLVSTKGLYDSSPDISHRCFAVRYAGWVVGKGCDVPIGTSSFFLLFFGVGTRSPVHHSQ